MAREGPPQFPICLTQPSRLATLLQLPISLQFAYELKSLVIYLGQSSAVSASHVNINQLEYPLHNYFDLIGRTNVTLPHLKKKTAKKNNHPYLFSSQFTSNF